MAQAFLREHLINCTCCKQCELVDDGVFCRSCNSIVLNLPHDVVDLLRCEEIWADKWDSLHSILTDFILKLERPQDCVESLRQELVAVSA